MRRGWEDRNEEKQAALAQSSAILRPRPPNLTEFNVTDEKTEAQNVEGTCPWTNPKPDSRP